MANYYTQTVVQPLIPREDMTDLEFLLLSNIFSHEELTDGNIYFFAPEGSMLLLTVKADELEEAIAKSSTVEHMVFGFLTDPRNLNKISKAAEHDSVMIDVGELSVPEIFQDIIKRSETLKYVTIEASYTCSKMRPDGFGGSADFITADDIQSTSTTSFIEECIEALNTGNQKID